MIEDHIIADDDAADRLSSTIIDDAVSVYSMTTPYSVPPFIPQTPPPPMQMPQSPAMASVVVDLPTMPIPTFPRSPEIDQQLLQQEKAAAASRRLSTPNRSSPALSDVSSTFDPRIRRPSSASSSGASTPPITADPISRELGLKVPLSEIDTAVIRVSSTAKIMRANPARPTTAINKFRLPGHRQHQSGVVHQPDCPEYRQQINAATSTTTTGFGCGQSGACDSVQCRRIRQSANSDPGSFRHIRSRRPGSVAHDADSSYAHRIISVIVALDPDNADTISTWRRRLRHVRQAINYCRQ